MPTVKAAPLAGFALRCQPDARLVALCRDGHERAFDEIVRRYRPALVSFAGAIVPAHLAEDVVQEALTKAHASLVASGGAMNLKPWLYTIVRNRALNDLRDDPDHERLGDDFDGVPQPPEVAAEHAELAAVLAGLKALPPAQREALIRRELEGRSHDEIAVAIGVTPGAVRGLIFRARTAMRNAAGALVPLPALRALLNAGPPATDATAVGAGGAAAGLTAGGGGAIAIKAGAALLVAGLAVGSGVALQDRGEPKDATAATVARSDGPATKEPAGPTGGLDRGSGRAARSEGGSSGRGPGGQQAGSSRGAGPSREGDGTGGHRAGGGHGDGHESEPATESESEGSGHDGGDRGGESPEHGGSGTSGHGGSGSDDGGSGSSDSGSGSSGSGSGSSDSGSGSSGSDSSGSGSGTSSSGHGSSDGGSEPASTDAEA